jgi:hypothetical protein
MTKGKTHIEESDFRRYLNDEMTNAERNAFERELQKHPFDAEAMEGMEQLSAAELGKNLNDLKTLTSTKKRKNSTSYFAVAATILLLVTAGVIWMQLDKQNPIPQMTQNETVVEINNEAEEEQSEPVIPAETIEKEVSPISEIAELHSVGTEKSVETIIEVPVKKGISAKKAIARKQTTVSAAQEMRKMDSEAQPVERIDLDEDLEFTFTKEKAGELSAVPAPSMKSKQRADIATNKILSGIIVSADDKMPITGATIVEKGTSNGIISDTNGRFKLQLTNDTNTLVASFIGMEEKEFQPKIDSDITITLKPDELALNEVVVVGYGTQRKSATSGSVTVVNEETKTVEATPIDGYKNYYDYLKTKAILPDTYSEKKIVVRVELKLDANGKIESISNLNNASDDFFLQVKEMLLNGPGWTPKYIDNQSYASTVKLRVVFRKKEINK